MMEGHRAEKDVKRPETYREEGTERRRKSRVGRAGGEGGRGAES